MFNIAFQRSYKEGEAWRNSTSFGLAVKRPPALPASTKLRPPARGHISLCRRDSPAFALPAPRAAKHAKTRLPRKAIPRNNCVDFAWSPGIRQTLRHPLLETLPELARRQHLDVRHPGENPPHQLLAPGSSQPNCQAPVPPLAQLLARVPHPFPDVGGHLFGKEQAHLPGLLRLADAGRVLECLVQQQNARRPPPRAALRVGPPPARTFTNTAPQAPVKEMARPDLSHRSFSEGGSCACGTSTRCAAPSARAPCA